MASVSSITRRAWLLMIAAGILINIFTPLTTYAVTASAWEELGAQTERWMRFRGIIGCIYERGLLLDSQEKIEKGHLFNKGATAIGYVGYPNGDGKVSCDDEAFVDNSLGLIGFKDNTYAYCAAQPSSYRENGPDSKSTSDLEGCVNGSGYYNNAEDHSKIASQWLGGLKTQVSDYKDFMTDSGGQLEASKYYMYYQSLVTFCGAKPGDEYTGSADQKKEVEGDNKKVVINVVDGEGEMQPYVYSLDRDEGDTIDDIYNNMGGDSDDYSCVEMARKLDTLDDNAQAYVKNYNKENPDALREGIDEASSAAGSSDNPVCSAGALGWVICPAINFIATMTDSIYEVVKTMLYIDPVTVETGGPLYQTWKGFRDVANILFIAVFLIVVFSQATSYGLSSYGIKKIVPRILAAAVLVNLSFFICQIAIDLSNIVGVGIAGLVNSMRSGVTLDINYISWDTVIAAGLLGGGAVAGIGVVAAAGSIPAAMAMILPFLVTALFAIVTAIAVLIARQVLIILLVALAPLAFIAIVLPNTQKYFQMWQNTFTIMLVMFPLITLLFSGSQLAANIVLTSASSGDGIGFFMLIAAVSMLFLPLFGVPYIVKFSGGAIGRLAGVINNPKKGPFDALRKKAEGYRDMKGEQARGRNLDPAVGAKGAFASYSRMRSRREDKYARVKDKSSRANQRYLSGMYSGQNTPFDESAVDVSAANGNVDQERAIRARAKQEAQTLAGERFAKKQLGGVRAEHYSGSDLQAELNRARAGAISQENEESRKRSAAIQQLFSQREQGLDLDQTLDMYEDAYKKAAADGDHETAGAVLHNVYTKGGSGRSRFASMISNHQIKGTEAQKQLEEVIYSVAKDNRADVVKGGMDNSTGTWKLAGASGMSYEQVAKLDDKAMYRHLSTISQAQADHILGDDNLKSLVQTGAARAMLEARKNNSSVVPTDPIDPTKPAITWDSLKET